MRPEEKPTAVHESSQSGPGISDVGNFELAYNLPIFLSWGRRSNDSIDNFIYMTPLYMKT